MAWFRLKNILDITLETEWKRQFRRESVLKEEAAEIFINGKNAMAVLDTNEFERHTGGAFHSIFVAT